MTSVWRDAVAREDLEAMARLLDSGTDINARDEHGQTALMNAACNGRAGAVRLLVKRGADLNHSAKYGLTALMIAVIRGHADVVRILVDAGADVTRTGTGAPGFFGKTARDLARGGGHLEIIEMLTPPTPAG